MFKRPSELKFFNNRLLQKQRFLQNKGRMPHLNAALDFLIFVKDFAGMIFETFVIHPLSILSTLNDQN